MQTSMAVTDSACIDLTECDREPIHLPESIQPHGILLALSTRDLRITAVSANLGMYCGTAPEALLGARLDTLTDAAGVELLSSDPPAPGQSRGVARLRLPGGAGPAWRGVLHAQEEGLLLEAERLAPGAEADAVDHFDRLHAAIHNLQSAHDFGSTCRHLVTEVRRITGYSRVKLYRFDPDWSGEVIVEDSDGQMPSFLGLHFPASDIPAQARALYVSNGTRQIPDISYQPVRVLHSFPRPIDLSQIGLRSVSPIHLAYLRNMGVRASMSVSVLREGRLWGMVACHHPTAHRVPRDIIKACLLLSQVAASRLGLIEEAELARRDSTVKAVETRLLQQAAEAESRPGGLPEPELLRHHSQDVLDLLVDLLGASGLLLNIGGTTTVLGEAPSQSACAALLRWLADKGADTLVTDHLAADYPAAAALLPAAGMLAIKLGSAADDFIIWFRPEITRTVTWAGSPIKLVVHSDGHERLSPRHSFAAWNEQVRDRARPWTAANIAAANRMRDTLMEIVARRATQIQRMNRQLIHINAELESFAYIASHDLKEPLRQIEMFSSLLQRAFGRDTDPADKIERWFACISTSTQRLRTLIDHLAQYSRLGSEARIFAQADAGQVLAEVLQSFSGQIAATNCTIETGPLPVIMCDAIQLRQVFQNLVGNAIKYRHPDRPPLLRISAAPYQAPATGEAAMPMIAFRVEDNGIGFDERHSERIFKPFERLHSAEDYEGSGLGLAICSKVIERHGGTITASSRIGEGSVFTFTLPHRVETSHRARAT
jgi:light-regulated signal transduction histidine kinase (bacteriophytochrome)